MGLKISGSNGSNLSLNILNWALGQHLRCQLKLSFLIGLTLQAERLKSRWVGLLAYIQE